MALIRSLLAPESKATWPPREKPQNTDGLRINARQGCQPIRGFRDVVGLLGSAVVPSTGGRPSSHGERQHYVSLFRKAPCRAFYLRSAWHTGSGPSV